MSEKHHYYLISGTIMFTFGEITEETIPQSTLSNAIVRFDNNYFPAHKLGKAQQNLVKTFIDKVPEPEHIKIHDIIIQTICNIGCMTEEEFQAEAPMPAQKGKPNLTMVETHSVLEPTND